MTIRHTGYCFSHRNGFCNCGAADTIYDESGIIIGEARPLVEPSDIEMPDILDDDVLPTSGIIVEEYTDTISRNYFVLEYLRQREKSNVNIYHCW